jgi:hypothetical protein
VATKFKHKCEILADIWLNYRNDEDFTDFIVYNDLGLPLAYAISEGIVEKTALAKTFVEETFDLLLAGLEVEDDTGFKNLDEML